MYSKLFEEAKAMEQELIGWRRTLHGMPELGMELPNTSAFIQERLKELDVPFDVVADGSCVIGHIGQGERCFLLRSDMDALPIREESGLEFASDSGRMHACGHDMHAAVLLGAAKLLKPREDELKGQIKLLFQPGEETFSGASKAIEDGLLENPKVDAAFAMHVSAELPVGTIIYGKAPMAAVYGFKITLTGKGGHGSTPEDCIDPINTAVHIHLALQELISRECPTSKEAALTIGQFSAGSAPNIIPGTAVLQGTLRTFDKELARYLVRRIGEVVDGVSAVYRTKAELEVLSNLPSVSCDEELNESLAAAIRAMDPELQVLDAYHVMGSEDFAFISERVPSSYFSFGTAVEDGTEIYKEHNSKVRFNEKALPIGVAAYACAALQWLNSPLK